MDGHNLLWRGVMASKKIVYNESKYVYYSRLINTTFIIQDQMSGLANVAALKNLATIIDCL